MDIAQLKEIAESQEDLLLSSNFAEFIIAHKIEYGELTIETSPENLLPLVDGLKRNRMFEYTTLVDVTAVDHPERKERFTVVYHFLSMTQNQRLRLHVKLGEGESLPSLCELHPTANWFEREVFDMFGIGFSGHPDMRRILTDYGFEGHPLRKDFPMTGYVQMRYDEAAKRCVYEPVELVQEYRSFDFLSPWEGAQYILPGDDKKAP